MADLTVSYDYLDDLEGTLRDIATLVDGNTLSASDHSVSQSASVEAAGNEAIKFQVSLSTVLVESFEAMAASVGQSASTLAETNARLSDRAANGGRPVNPGAY